MIYLFIGENTQDKQSQIGTLKAPWAANPDALQFDYQALYGHKLDPKDLKKSLLALPAILKQRMIYIHEVDKLNDHCKTILLEFISSRPVHVILILESLNLPKDNIWTQIRALAKVHESRKTVKENVFDMTKKMTTGKSAEALQSLNQLYEDGAHPLQILGGVVWAWGNERSRVSPENFEKGLRALQDADLNIKRSRLPSEQAVEVLVVKLAALKKTGNGFDRSLV